MEHRPPIALVVFSNDLDDYLSNIETERKAIEEALEHYDDTNRLKVITRSSVDIEGLFQLFNRYSGRIVLFHFAGHADGYGLQLNSTNQATMTGKAEGIAALIHQEATEGQLKLVFLNGCSTLKQVEGLKAVGVPSVIATHFPIDDDEAVQFSNIFYRTWAKADDQATAFDASLTTLQTAFDAALAYLKTKHKIKIERQERGLRLRRNNWDEEIPWELFTTNPDQTLDFEEAKESKTFNEHLTWNVTTALKNHPTIAAFLEDNAADWYLQIRYQNIARGKIEKAFPWVITWELRRLFAIGRASLSAKKIHDYIEHSLLTYRLIFQLVNYTLITQLWDESIGIDRRKYRLTYRFFVQKQEFTTVELVALFHELRQIYLDKQLQFPFKELKKADFDFKIPMLQRACQKLQALEEKVFSRSLQQLHHCFNAEKQLTTVLETFSFLANYQLVSMRKIEFQQLRNNRTAPYYIKDFTVLGRKQNKRSEHQRMVQYDNIPTDAYAIFLFKQGTTFNLFPFLIDYHALINQSLNAKIYFYECREQTDGLKYYFIDGQEHEILRYEGISQKVKQNKLVEEQDENKLKIDIALEQFMAAYNTLFDENEEFKVERKQVNSFNF